MEPLISVIVPVCNTEKYLPRCLDSVSMQTYKKLEIILVYSDSADNSHEICMEYAKRDKRIIVEQDNRAGVGAARDKGLDIASGEWICFLDSDDFFHPQFVEIMLQVVMKNDCLTAQCRYEEVFGNAEGRFGKIAKPVAITMEWRKYLLYLFQHTDEHYSPFGVWLNIYHRSLFDGIRFDGIQAGEDSYIAPKLLYAASSKSVGIVDAALYFYCVRQDSLLHRPFNLNWLDHWYAKECAANFWKEKGEYELYNWFYSIYFNTLVIDYLRFCVHLPNEKIKYDIMRKKIIENHEEARRRGEEILLLHPGAKSIFEELEKSNITFIQYGYGNYGRFAHPFLRDIFSVKEIWDEKAVQTQTVAGIPLTHPHHVETQNVVLLIAVQDALTNVAIELEMKKYGINRFIPCKIMKFVLRFGLFKKYLPFLIE